MGLRETMQRLGSALMLRDFAAVAVIEDTNSSRVVRAHTAYMVTLRDEMMGNHATDPVRAAPQVSRSYMTPFLAQKQRERAVHHLPRLDNVRR